MFLLKLIIARQGRDLRPIANELNAQTDVGLVCPTLDAGRGLVTGFAVANTFRRLDAGISAGIVRVAGLLPRSRPFLRRVARDLPHIGLSL